MFFMNIVFDDYFRAMDVDLLEGRGEPGDMRGADSVLVVNRAAADLLWPRQRAVGQTLGVVIGLVGSFGMSFVIFKLIGGDGGFLK